MAKKLPSNNSNKIILFEDDEIRRVEFDGDWFYVIEDVIKALTNSTDPKGYIRDLRRRDEEISKGWGQIATPLPIMTKGGRQNINCANAEGVFRLIQSVPSKNAEPFKRWLARVGKERLEEIEQPAMAIERAKGYYLAKGYDPKWVQSRTAGIETRHKFTDTLKEHGIKGKEYGILTNELYTSSFGLNAYDYKKHKNLKEDDSLRDNMTVLEIATVMFSEATSTELIEKTGADGFVETKKAIHIAGNITKEAIEKLEEASGKKVVTHENAKALNSPEIQKELVQQSLPKEKEELSEFNKNLVKGLNTSPKDFEKPTSALSLKSIKKRKEHKNLKDSLDDLENDDTPEEPKGK